MLSEEKLVEYFEAEGSYVDTMPATSDYACSDSQFISMIRFHKVPILPPILTEADRREMCGYRNRAILAETRLNSRRREQRMHLLTKVEAVIKSLEESKNILPVDPADTSLGFETRINDELAETSSVMQNEDSKQTIGATSIDFDKAADTVTASMDSLIVNSAQSEDPVICKPNDEILSGPPLHYSLSSSLLQPNDNIKTRNDVVEKKRVFPELQKKSNQCSNVIVSTSTGSSATTVSTESDEFAQTVIALDELKQINAQKVTSQTSQENKQLTPNKQPVDNKFQVEIKNIQEGGLLEKVDLVPCHLDTHQTSFDQTNKTPLQDSMIEDTPIIESKLTEDGTSLHSIPTIAVSSASLEDPTTIRNIPDANKLTLLPSSSNKSPQGDQDVLSVTYPTEVSLETAHGTASTDLAQYMQGSLDTITSSLTIVEQPTESVSLDDCTSDNTDHLIDTLEGAVGGTSSTPIMNTYLPSAFTQNEPSTPKANTSLRSSYTLDEPSPILLQSHLSDVYIGEGRGDEIQYSTVVEGKQEHLRRYLKQLGQQPPFPLQQQELSPSLDLLPVQQPEPRLSLTDNSDLSHENLLHKQEEHFHRIRQQLIQQQKEQLAALLLRQQNEQIQFQQTILEQANKRKADNYLRHSQGSGEERLSSDGVVHPHLSSTDSVVSDQTRVSFDKPKTLDNFLHHSKNYASSTHGSSLSNFSDQLKHRHLNGIHRRSMNILGKVLSEDDLKKFDKLTAAVRGHLTRRLFHTDRVQRVIKTIRDTAEFAVHFQEETPIKRGVYTHQDRDLQERVIAQLRAALLDLHEIFFETTMSERMSIIAQQGQWSSTSASSTDNIGGRRISMVTEKVRQRRVNAHKNDIGPLVRPWTAPPDTSSPIKKKKISENGCVTGSQVLKPIHAEVSPIKPIGHPKKTRGAALAPQENYTMKPVIGQTKTAKKGLFCVGATGAKKKTGRPLSPKQKARTVKTRK